MFGFILFVLLHRRSTIEKGVYDTLQPSGRQTSTNVAKAHYYKGHFRPAPTDAYQLVLASLKSLIGRFRIFSESCVHK